MNLAGCIKSTEWIDERAFERIVERTFASMRNRPRNPVSTSIHDIPRCVLDRARALLNETIAFSHMCQFQQIASLDFDQIASDAAAALRYFDLMDGMRRIGFGYETASPELRSQLESTVRNYEHDRGLPAYRGRNHWEARFYPEVLGLFQALFGEEPAASLNQDTGKSESPALVFIAQIITEIPASNAADDLFRASQFAGLDFEDWTYHSGEALRNKVSDWKKRPKHASVEEKEWVKNARGFKALFDSLKSN